MNKQNSQWLEQEDAAITNLYEQRRIQDWNQIARILNQQYHFAIKNSKQYKQRYFNHLCHQVFKIEWTEQQQILFMKLHNQIGNKWATIAQQLIGKTDNCVKNHFYSKLRKLLRKLNKIIQFYLKKQFRPIDISIMYKIVQAAQQRFKDKPTCDLNVSLQCLNIQNRMLQFAMFKNVGQNQQEQQLKYSAAKIQQYRQLIREIYRVSKLYKRKSKKVRNSLIQAPVNNTKKKIKKQVKLQQQDEEYQQSMSVDKPRLSNHILIKSQNGNQYEDQSIKKQDLQEQSQYKKQQQTTKNIKQKNKKNGHASNKIQVQQGDGIQQLLRTAGILHDQIKQNNGRKQKNSRKYSTSQYSINSGNPMISSPSLSSQPMPMNFITNNSSAQYSPLHSFTSNQVQNFLGFPMVNNNNPNGYANFTLSQKSSFKSYSQIDPSQIQNPFFDYESSNTNNRIMFPMNFNVPINNQYQQLYNNTNNMVNNVSGLNSIVGMDNVNGNLPTSYNSFNYSNMYYQQSSGQQQDYKQKNMQSSNK